MYKLTMKNVVAFTNWWNKQGKKRKASEKDACKYFGIPYLK